MYATRFLQSPHRPPANRVRERGRNKVPSIVTVLSRNPCLPPSLFAHPPLSPPSLAASAQLPSFQPTLNPPPHPVCALFGTKNTYGGAEGCDRTTLGTPRYASNKLSKRTVLINCLSFPPPICSPLGVLSQQTLLLRTNSSETKPALQAPPLPAAPAAALHGWLPTTLRGGPKIRGSAPAGS